MKGFIDKVLAWTISKKLTVFFVATILVFQDKINGKEWVYVALIYISTQAAIDLYNSIKK